MPGPLTDQVRILDLSERSPAAAIAGMVLADLGAEVIRVEPPDGDPVRALSGSEVWLRGQRSITLTQAEVRTGAWCRLRDSAAVIIDTAQPWIAKPLGLLDGFDPQSGQIAAILTAYPRAVDEVTPAGAGSNQPVYGELIEAQYGIKTFRKGFVRMARISWAGLMRPMGRRGCSKSAS